MSRPQSFATRISSDIGRLRLAARARAPQPVARAPQAIVCASQPAPAPRSPAPRPQAICTTNIHHGIMTANVNTAVTAIFTAPHFAKSFRVT